MSSSSKPDLLRDLFRLQSIDAVNPVLVCNPAWSKLLNDTVTDQKAKDFVRFAQEAVEYGFQCSTDQGKRCPRGWRWNRPVEVRERGWNTAQPLPESKEAELMSGVLGRYLAGSMVAFLHLEEKLVTRLMQALTIAVTSRQLPTSQRPSDTAAQRLLAPVSTPEDIRGQFDDVYQLYDWITTTYRQARGSFEFLSKFLDPTSHETLGAAMACASDDLEVFNKGSLQIKEKERLAKSHGLIANVAGQEPAWRETLVSSEFCFADQQSNSSLSKRAVPDDKPEKEKTKKEKKKKKKNRKRKNDNKRQQQEENWEASASNLSGGNGKDLPGSRTPESTASSNDNVVSLEKVAVLEDKGEEKNIKTKKQKKNNQKWKKHKERQEQEVNLEVSTSNLSDGIEKELQGSPTPESTVSIDDTVSGHFAASDYSRGLVRTPTTCTSIFDGESTRNDLEVPAFENEDHCWDALGSPCLSQSIPQVTAEDVDLMQAFDVVRWLESRISEKDLSQWLECFPTWRYEFATLDEFTTFNAFSKLEPLHRKRTIQADDRTGLQKRGTWDVKGSRRDEKSGSWD